MYHITVTRDHEGGLQAATFTAAIYNDTLPVKIVRGVTPARFKRWQQVYEFRRVGATDVWNSQLFHDAPRLFP